MFAALTMSYAEGDLTLLPSHTGRRGEFFTFKTAVCRGLHI